MNPDQSVRAAAAQAAATLMAPIQPIPADFIATAEVIEMYIAHGKDAAFALCFPPEPVAEQPEKTPAVEQEAPAIERPEPAAIQDVPLPPLEQPVEPEPVREAQVIALPQQPRMPAKQEGALRMIEKTKKARVDSLMNVASVAKVKAHKERLIVEAEDAGLSEYPVTVKGLNTTLGAYLGSLL